MASESDDDWVIVGEEDAASGAPVMADSTTAVVAGGGPALATSAGCVDLLGGDAAAAAPPPPPRTPVDDEDPILTMLLARDAAAAEELRLEEERQEAARQQCIANMKAAGAATVAAGVATVATVKTAASATVRGITEAERVTTAAVRKAAMEVADASCALADAAGEALVTHLCPEDLEGLYGALDNFLGVLTRYVVDGIPLAGVVPIAERARELRGQHPLQEALKQLEAGSEETTFDMMTDTLLSLMPGGTMAVLFKMYFAQLRVVACVAALYGHDCSLPETQSTMLWCLAPAGKGGSGEDEDDGAQATAAAAAAAAAAGGGQDGSGMLAAARQQVAKLLMTQMLKAVGLGQARTVGAAFTLASKLWAQRYSAQTGETEKSAEKGTEKGLLMARIVHSARLQFDSSLGVHLPLLDLALPLLWPPAFLAKPAAAADTGAAAAAVAGGGAGAAAAATAPAPSRKPVHLQYRVTIGHHNCRLVCAALLGLWLLPALLSVLALLL